MRRCMAMGAALLVAAAMLGCRGNEESSAAASGHVNLGGASSGGDEAAEITVFAAASLTEAFGRLAADLKASDPSLKVTFVFEGTQELLAKLEHGAPADVFAAASERDMDQAIEADLVGDRQTFATNRLCVAAYPDSPLVSTFEDIAGPDVSLLVAVAECPVGRYTRQCWAKMAVHPDYGPEFTRQVEANVRSNETNVKAVVSKVHLGECDAGFVYESDAHAEGDKVRVIRLPDDLAVMATYQVAVCADAEEPEAGRRFIEHLVSEAGAAALESCGFTPVSDQPPAEGTAPSDG